MKISQHKSRFCEVSCSSVIFKIHINSTNFFYHGSLQFSRHTHARWKANTVIELRCQHIKAIIVGGRSVQKKTNLYHLEQLVKIFILTASPLFNNPMLNFFSFLIGFFQQPVKSSSLLKYFTKIKSYYKLRKLFTHHYP